VTIGIDISTLSLQTGAMDAQADRLLKRAQSTSTTGLPATNEDAKIKKAGSDFESILLGSWLQQAENSFATVPGGDEEDDGGTGKDQFQGIAMQALAGSLTKSGGIGIAKMITQHLHSAASSERTHADAKKTAADSSKASS
jgi:Rod binding domain-containing protein